MPTFREGGPEEDDAILPEQVLQQTLAFCHSTQVLATVNPSNCVVHRCPTSTSTSRTNSGNISCTEEGPINSALTHNHSIPTSIHGFRPVATLGRGNKGTVVLVIAKQTGAPFALKINSCRESSDVDPVMVMDQSNVSMQMKAKKNQDIHLLLSHVDAAADHNISDHYDDHPLLPDRCDGNEKEILSLLRPHPFLQTLHGHFESGKHSLLLLDFCSGGDLHRLQYKQPEKRFSETAARHV